MSTQFKITPYEHPFCQACSLSGIWLATKQWSVRLFNVLVLYVSLDSAKLSLYLQKHECEQICLSLCLSNSLSAAGSGRCLSPPALSVTVRTAALASGWHSAGHPSAHWLSSSSKAHIPVMPTTPAFHSHLWMVILTPATGLLQDICVRVFL